MPQQDAALSLQRQALIFRDSAFVSIAIVNQMPNLVSMLISASPEPKLPGFSLFLKPAFPASWLSRATFAGSLGSRQQTMHRFEIAEPANRLPNRRAISHAEVRTEELVDQKLEELL